MRYPWFLVFLFMFSGLLYGQCDNCTFVRGDANCDGAVNIADYYAINNFTWSNNDAADVNDNGVVNPSDATYLLNFLFNGGAAPACPFPASGRDCTADNLEKCCSPPTGHQTGILPTDGVEEWEVNDGWNNLIVDDEVSLNADGITVTAENYSSCSKTSSTATVGFDGAMVTDTTGFTRSRLEAGVQVAKLKCYLNPIQFSKTGVCQGSQCDGWNQLSVTGPYESVVHVAPKSGGGSPKSFALEWNEEFFYDYTRVQYIPPFCTMEEFGSPAQGILVTIDISESLAEQTTGDCDEWKITELEFNDIKLKFTRGPYPDIAGTEKIILDAFTWVEYSWCTCP